MATEASRPTYARPSLERAHDDPAERQFRRRLRLYQELTVRGGVALVIVAFQLVFPVEPPVTARCISLLALLGLFLNGPYFLAARSGRAFRAQAYVRMLVDVLLISVGLYFAGGLAAAHCLGIYLIVMIYAGITFSSRACLAATAAATGGYVAIVSLQHAGVLSAPFELPNATMIAAFNLIVLNIAGALTAILSRALRQSRRRLRATYQELERFVEAIPDVIYVVDRTGRLTLWNQKLESVTGRAREALKGELLTDLLAEEDRERCRARLQQCAHRGHRALPAHALPLPARRSRLSGPRSDREHGPARRRPDAAAPRVQPQSGLRAPAARSQRHRHQRERHARAAHRRAHRAGGDARPEARPRDGRPESDRAGHRQLRGQRARRDA